MVNFREKWRTCMLFAVSLLTGCASYQGSTGFMGGDSADVQYSMGVNRLLGQGVEKNDRAAVAAFQRAASAGSPYAEAQLGFMYAAGQGVPKDEAMAFHWYALAADQGLASAQYNLGLMLEKGIGTPRDPVRARTLFQEAASRGFDPARRALAR